MSSPAFPFARSRRPLCALALLLLPFAALAHGVTGAEYGIDPTGFGARLGLDVLAATAEAAEPESVPAPATPASPGSPDHDAPSASLRRPCH